MITVNFPIEWRVHVDAECVIDGRELISPYELRITAPFVPVAGMCILCPDSWDELEVIHVTLVPRDSEATWCAVDVVRTEGSMNREYFSEMPSWKPVLSDDDL